MRLLPLSFFLVLNAMLPVMAEKGSLLTQAETSQFKQTGRYEEVERLCEQFAATWPDAVHCIEFGRTPEGRPLMALAISHSGALTPKQAASRGIPVLAVQGGIHPGESDGKDAGFIALRALLSEKSQPD